MSQVRAIRALRLNYRWRGVRVWLLARHWYRWTSQPPYMRVRCSQAVATWTPRGWWLVLRYPSLVIASQTLLAEGVPS